MDLGHAHTVIQFSGRTATEQANSWWMNIVLSDVKRSLDVAYHAFAFCNHTHRYLAQATWRFNRRFQLEALVPRLLVAAAKGPPWGNAGCATCPSIPADT